MWNGNRISVRNVNFRWLRRIDDFIASNNRFGSHVHDNCGNHDYDSGGNDHYGSTDDDLRRNDNDNIIDDHNRSACRLK